MARLFTAASNHSIVADNASHPLTAYPYTFAAWIRASTSHTGTIMGIAQSSAGNKYFAIRLNSGVVTITARNTTLYNTAGDSAPLNKWQSVVCVFRAEQDHELYQDGVSTGVDVTNSTPASAGINRTMIGRNMDSSPTWPFNGRIAEAATWSAALTVGEIMAYHNGVTPDRIRQTNLTAYYPLLGKSLPEPDVSRFKVHGVVTGAERTYHAPVRRYVRPDRYFLAPPAAAVSTQEPIQLLMTGVG